MKKGFGTIEIREGRASDAVRFEPYFAALAGDVSPWFPGPSSAEHAGVWLRHSGFLDFENSLHWIALDDNRMVGHLFFHRRDIPSIGLEGIVTSYLSVGTDYRESGLGRALMDLWNPTATDKLRKLGVRRISGHVFPENIPCIRLIQSVGLKPEGVLRQHMRGRDGQYHDMIAVGQILTDHSCEECTRSVEEHGFAQYQWKEFS